MKLFARGFTFIELMVAITIISILAAIVGVSYADVRANARDAKRMSDIEQIGLALRMYAIEHGSSPVCVHGLVLEPGRDQIPYTNTSCRDDGGDGSVVSIKDYLKDYFGEIPIDPLGPGNADYYYYYDSVHNCFTNDDSAAMVFAVNLETKPSNATTACEVQSGNEGGYMSTDSINPSQPYVYVLNRL